MKYLKIIPFFILIISCSSIIVSKNDLSIQMLKADNKHLDSITFVIKNNSKKKYWFPFETNYPTKQIEREHFERFYFSPVFYFKNNEKKIALFEGLPLIDFMMTNQQNYLRLRRRNTLIISIK